MSQQHPKPASTEKLPQGKKPADWFHKFSQRISEIMGRPRAFMIALLIIIIWAILGPACGFSDTWQLVINTATTIITFLMVFLIQNTQNRDAKAFHLKLDELIHAIKGARNKLIDLEDLSDEELATLEKQFKKISSAHQKTNKPPHR